VPQETYPGISGFIYVSWARGPVGVNGNRRLADIARFLLSVDGHHLGFCPVSPGKIPSLPDPANRNEAKALFTSRPGSDN
jgi:hypothetical protein